MTTEVIQEQEEKSPRLVAAESLAWWVQKNHLNNPYGGVVNRGCDRKNRAYYSVGFSKPGVLDGSISVYSPKYFVVKFFTRLKFLPAEDRVLIKNVDQLHKFLTVAFIDMDEEKTFAVLGEIIKMKKD